MAPRVVFFFILSTYCSMGTVSVGMIPASLQDYDVSTLGGLGNGVSPIFLGGVGREGHPTGRTERAKNCEGKCSGTGMENVKHGSEVQQSRVRRNLAVGQRKYNCSKGEVWNTVKQDCVPISTIECPQRPRPSYYNSTSGKCIRAVPKRRVNEKPHRKSGVGREGHQIGSTERAKNCKGKCSGTGMENFKHGSKVQHSRVRRGNAVGQPKYKCSKGEVWYTVKQKCVPISTIRCPQRPRPSYYDPTRGRCVRAVPKGRVDEKPQQKSKNKK